MQSTRRVSGNGPLVPRPLEWCTMLLASAGLSFVIAFAAVRVLLSPRARFALDEPNDRSLHVTPVPRTGGLAIFTGLVIGTALGGPEVWLPLLLALFLATISLYDDLRGLDHRARLAAHVLAAAIGIWYILSPINPVPMVLLVVAVVWV